MADDYPRNTRDTDGGDAPEQEESRGQGGGRRFGGRRGGPGGGARRRRVCQFCADKVKTVDYKDVNLLRQFTARSSGRIVARRKTGACAKHQRILTRAVKRARHLALLPYTAGQSRGYRP